MHYYKRNIGDYAKKAGRLTMLQHGSYTLLIDACYDRERFPTLDEAIEWTWASTTEEIEAVTFVLRKFFTVEDGLHVQNRIREDIEAYHGNAATNRRIALERETNRKAKSTNRARSVDEPPRSEHEAPPNHEPLTINQEPLTKNQGETRKARKASPPKPEDVDQEVWDDWLSLRAKKQSPVTATVLKSAIKESAKAGLHLQQFLEVWCIRGSAGLMADWLRPDERNQPSGETAYQRNRREFYHQHQPNIAAKAPGQIVHAVDFFENEPRRLS